MRRYDSNLENAVLDPPEFFHHTFPPLPDPFKRRFGLVVARFRKVNRNIQCRITDVLDVQFRITEVLDVTFTNLYVLNRNALVENNGYGWAGRSFDDINPIGSYLY